MDLVSVPVGSNRKLLVRKMLLTAGGVTSAVPSVQLNGNLSQVMDHGAAADSSLLHSCALMHPHSSDYWSRQANVDSFETPS